LGVSPVLQRDPNYDVTSCARRTRQRLKRWFDPKLVDTLNDHPEIMTENLTERSVLLGGRGLAANGTLEFPFDHAHGGFNVRPLVVEGQEYLTVVRVLVTEARPDRTSVGSTPTLVLKGMYDTAWALTTALRFLWLTYGLYAGTSAIRK
jgi:hypothetical protein